MKITAVKPIHLRVPVVEEIPDGTLDVPGLGIELAEEIVEKFRVPY